MSDTLSIEEVESLGYYDFMGYVGVPFFNIGGFTSIDRLAEICHITGQTMVLEVGCGTGTNACYLAKKFGCSVVGVDISKHMVQHATRRVAEQGLVDRVTFRVGNAYDLEFPDNTFDVVITIFVSQFLDPARAFHEFHRVLRDAGHLGVNEMYKADHVPSTVEEQVDTGVKALSELTELPFTLRSPSAWGRALKSAGFTDITLEEHPNSSHRPYSGSIVEEFGGWRKLSGTLWKILVYSLRSGKMREHFTKINGAKRILLGDEETSKYIGYVICVGRKNP